MGRLTRFRFGTLSILLACGCSESPSASGEGTDAGVTAATNTTTGTSVTTASGSTAASSSSAGGSTTTTTASTTGNGGGTTGSGGATSTGTETTSAGGGGATTSAGGATTEGASTTSMGGSSTTGNGGSGGSVNTDPDARKLLLRDEALSSLDYVDLADANNNWTVTVPTGRDLQVVGNRRVMIGTDNGYEERSIDDGSFVSEMNSYPGTLTAHRLHDKNTLLAGVDFAGGQGIVLVEVDSAGSEVDRVEFPAYGYVRLVRETTGGHFLVTSDTTIFEGDRDGNVTFTATVQDSTEPHAWKALRIGSNEILVSTGYAASLQIFDNAGAWQQTITGGGSDVNPYFFADVQVLPTGNFVVANWQGHETNLGSSGIQILEYDRQGELVWYWQQDASFISSLQHLVVLDGLDLAKLYVENVDTGVLEAVD